MSKCFIAKSYSKLTHKTKLTKRKSSRLYDLLQVSLISIGAFVNRDECQYNKNT